jgi:prevent-host-death family protein
MVTKRASSNPVPAGEFKARCLAILDEVKRTRRSIVVTKRGKPVARIVPIEEAAAPDSSLRGSVLREDDIVCPLMEVWFPSS